MPLPTRKPKPSLSSRLFRSRKPSGHFHVYPLEGLSLFFKQTTHMTVVMPPSISLRGQCACGSITWTSTQPATNLDFCYCKQCQLVSGAPVVAWLCLPRSGLSFSGPGHRKEFRLSVIASRSCCAECGGTLTLEYDHYPEKPWLAAGTVTSGEGSFPKPGSHMFVSSKSSWFQIADDGIRRCERFDQAFVEAWPETVSNWEAAGMDQAS